MRVAVLGAGLMGSAIAKRLHQDGLAVQVWNRSVAPLERLEGAGVAVTLDLDNAISGSDVLLLALSSFEVISEVVFSRRPGCLLDGKRIIQCGTISPQQSRQLLKLSEDAGARYVEAPVLGSIPEAASGSLIVMAGGTAADFEQVKPVLDILSEAPELVGGVGQGAALKLAMNQLIAGLTTAFSYSLGLVRKEGLDVDTFMHLLRQSALYAPTFDKKLGKMMDHEYASANFPLKHLVKDIGLFTEVAETGGQPVEVPYALKTLFEQAQSSGFADADYSALYEAVNPVDDKR